MYTPLPPAVEQQLGVFAESFADYLSALPPDAARTAMTVLCVRIVEECAKPESAARRAMTPQPVSPEIIAETLRTFNEAETLEAMRELQEGKGLTYEQTLPRLRRAASKPDPTSPV